MGDRIGIQLRMRELYLGLTNHPAQLSLAVPQWAGAVSTGQRTMMLCGWGVKADMARVWWQVKLCAPFYNACHI